MLRPKEIWEHDGVLNDVVSDLVARLRHVRDTEGDGQFAPHIPNELYKWSMECMYNCIRLVIRDHPKEDQLWSINPLMLRAAKTGLTILEIFF